jgi:hypothetical protein
MAKKMTLTVETPFGTFSRTTATAYRFLGIAEQRDNPEQGVRQVGNSPKHDSSLAPRYGANESQLECQRYHAFWSATEGGARKNAENYPFDYTRCVGVYEVAPVEQANESTGGVDGHEGIGYPQQQSAESTGGIVIDQAATIEAGQEQTTGQDDGGTTVTESKRARRPRGAKTTEGAVVVDQVPVSDVVLDSDVQPREHISTQTISEYADAMSGGMDFPAIVVYKDPSSGTLLAADGWHRVSAARQAGLATIKAEIRPGTKRDAVLYSVSANATHGLRRTDADKRRAVMRLLNDEEWAKWSASVIAEKAGVSQPFVSGLRRQLEEATGQKQNVNTADGRQMNTARIGRQPRQTAAPAAPAAPEANGHAPVAEDGEQDADSLLAGAAPTTAPEAATAPFTPGDPTEEFARQCMSVFMQLGDFDAKAVIDALDTEQQQALGAKWESIIELFDKYTDALEAVLS